MAKLMEFGQNKMEKVSVITISFNNAKGLEKTLQSSFSQTYVNIEQIVIDGGSTDGTLDILERYNDKISFSVSEPDNGIYDAMNKGLRKATGGWVILMNSGDVFASNNVLESLMQVANRDESIDALYSDYIEKCRTGKIIKKKTDRDKFDLHHQSFFYKKSLHDSLGYYNTIKPYTVSDLMFMLAVPKEKLRKVPFEIALIECDGLSSELWCAEKALALRVAYGQYGLFAAWMRYIKYKIMYILK